MAGLCQGKLDSSLPPSSGFGPPLLVPTELHLCLCPYPQHRGPLCQQAVAGVKGWLGHSGLFGEHTGGLCGSATCVPELVLGKARLEWGRQRFHMVRSTPHLSVMLLTPQMSGAGHSTITHPAPSKPQLAPLLPSSSESPAWEHCPLLRGSSMYSLRF